MKRFGHIVVLPILFVGLGSLLGKSGFWELAGVEPPSGLFFQGILFFSLYVILKGYLFEPYLKVLDERELQTSGKMKSLEELNEKSKQLSLRFQESLAAARLSAIREREAIAIQAEALEKEKLLQAKSSARAHVEQSSKLAQEELAQARASLGLEIQSWSNEIVKKVSSPVMSRSGLDYKLASVGR